MRKFLLFSLCVLGVIGGTCESKAQLLADIEGLPPYKLGATAGMNFSKFSTDGASMIPGFNLGLDLMLDASPLIKNTYLRVNLLIERKGTADYDLNKLIINAPDVSDVYPTQKADFKTVYLELPLSYGYAHKIDREWTVMGEMGPYFAFGLGGKCNAKEWAGGKYSGKYFGSSWNSVTKQKPNRFDVGWGIGVGAMFRNVHQVKLGYQMGFINMTDDFLQNRNLSINYTYFFE